MKHSTSRIPKTMLAVVKDKAEPGITVKEILVPETPKGEVFVKVLRASICGTDIGIYDWTPWVAAKIKPPIVIGHEVVGEVLEINGDAPHLKKGDIVSSETHIYDGTCYQCKIGNMHVCEHVSFFGYGRNGGFSEYATIPIRTTWKNDPAIPLDVMSVQEPLGNSVHTITKADVPGKRVLVVGLGATGLCAAAVAVAYGAKEVVAIDPEPYRRELMNAFEPRVKTQESLTKDQYDYFDAVCEMSGAVPGVQTCFDGVRIAGTIVALGIPKKEVSIDWGKYLIDKELRIESIFGRRIWETWYRTSDLITSGAIDLSKIITHTYALKDFNEAMAVMKSGKCGKVVLKVS